MGRKQSYFCDTCQTEFGDRPHINLEGLRLRVAYKTSNGWRTKGILPRPTQFHFCNALCINEWLTTQVEGLFSQVGGEHASPAN